MTPEFLVGLITAISTAGALFLKFFEGRQAQMPRARCVSVCPIEGSDTLELELAIATERPCVVRCIRISDCDIIAGGASLKTFDPALCVDPFVPELDLGLKPVHVQSAPNPEQRLTLVVKPRCVRRNYRVVLSKHPGLWSWFAWDTTELWFGLPRGFSLKTPA